MSGFSGIGGPVRHDVYYRADIYDMCLSLSVMAQRLPVQQREGFLLCLAAIAVMTGLPTAGTPWEEVSEGIDESRETELY